jgi:hypothetical protein
VSVVDQVSGFYAQHPNVVKALGGCRDNNCDPTHRLAKTIEFGRLKVNIGIDPGSLTATAQRC